MKKDIIILIARSVWYYSQYDEDAFFGWLDKLKCVSKYDGKGDVLYIHIHTHAVDESALRELLAVFHRYNIDMKQLTIFDRKEFALWFRSEKSYWFRSVFDVPPKTGRVARRSRTAKGARAAIDP
jgi:hypothetical protein